MTKIKEFLKKELEEQIENQRIVSQFKDDFLTLYNNLIDEIKTLVHDLPVKIQLGRMHNVLHDQNIPINNLTVIGTNSSFAISAQIQSGGAKILGTKFMVRFSATRILKDFPQILIFEPERKIWLSASDLNAEVSHEKIQKALVYALTGKEI